MFYNIHICTHLCACILHMQILFCIGSMMYVSKHLYTHLYAYVVLCVCVLEPFLCPVSVRGTLCSLKPLALSPSSKDKPEMLDIFVVAELTKFVKSLCQKGDPSEMDMVDPEQLSILLKYMLIIG